MNIFVTDTDPCLSAIALDDKRIGKMALESAQLLSTVLRRHGIDAPYKPVDHPLVDWADADPLALFWLWSHYEGLLNEWEYRYEKEHGAKVILPLKHKLRLPPGDYTRLPVFYNNAKRKSLNLDYTSVPDTIEAYRLYLRARWALAHPVWTARGKPSWA